ncbi:class I SAM-dependent methyltransferase [Sphingobium aquiterrae]|uniref:class I SAM-dependent methyltransferase n=1 Tax=Sphingobium aquiterrae TaxID=2038656 RepID=UPI00301964AB
MTTKNLTGMLAKKMPQETGTARTKGETLFQLFFALIQWPWLLKSLYGGNKAEKNAVLERINLEQDALPHLGSWKADTYLLHRIVDEIEVRQPKNVVELGSGVTSLVIAKALSLHGGGHLYSYDQYEPFVEQMGIWLAEHHLSASFSHAPLNFRDQAWPGLWYALHDLPQTIDLLVIDGPPWSIHPFTRGMAERLFERIAPGGLIMLDDAARPGERYVARRWRKTWRDFEFKFEGKGTKGLLIGERMIDGNNRYG